MNDSEIRNKAYEMGIPFISKWSTSRIKDEIAEWEMFQRISQGKNNNK